MPGAARDLEVMDGQNTGSAEMLWEIMPDEVVTRIKSVGLDMSSIYASVASTMDRQAKDVHDRFHVFRCSWL
jgi:transposase